MSLDFPVKKPSCLMSEGKEQIKVYGVSELTDVIKGLFKRFDKIYVEGEISGWKVYSSGHAYFTVKDENAQLSCVMFSSAIARCKAASRLADGAKVCLYGRIDVYAPRGTYQMVVLAAKIAGEGDLMARFNELKELLQKEGLFDRSRKRKLPLLPRRIGVVTSPSGAVIHDMCTVLTRRFPNLEIRLYPVKVQGPGAKEEIVEGIRFFNREDADWVPDILIVGRGGGSIEDLWAFNEECVVRAVAASGIPVISAVGHETDFTLCDFAADVRAGTPSIAAEIAVPVKTELLQQVNDLAARLKRAPERAGEVFAQRIDHLSVRLSSALRNSASSAEMRLAKSAQRLVPALQDAVAAAESRLLKSSQRILPALKDAVAAAERSLTGMDQKLLTPLKDSVARNERRLATAEAKLKLLDPSNPLKRGYSLTLGADGGIIRSVSSVKPGDTLHTRLADGEISSKVSG